MDYYEIKNLTKYQPTYKDGRKLIWIRWYVDCLSDYKFAKLTPEQKWLFIGLSMLQVKEQGIIPKDTTWICHQLQYPEKHIENDLVLLKELNLLVTKYDDLSQNTTKISPIKEKMRGEDKRGDGGHHPSPRKQKFQFSLSALHGKSPLKNGASPDEGL